MLFNEHSSHRELVVCDDLGNAEVILCDHSWHTDVVVCDHSGHTEVAARDQSSSSAVDTVAAQVPQDVTNSTTDSALAWGCVTALLGSPAPRVVLPGGERRHRKRIPVNLWPDEVGVEELCDIILPSSDKHAADLDAHEALVEVMDDCSIPSVMPEEAHEDYFLPDMDDIPDVLAFPAMVTRKGIDEDIADSTLAWIAHAALLGSPAPFSAVRRNEKKDRLNLWDTGEETISIPEIDEQENFVRDPQDGSDSLVLASVDLSELEDSNKDFNLCFDNHINVKNNAKEAAESALAWGALGMLLGSPAPKTVSRQSTKSPRGVAEYLFNDSGAMGDDGWDSIPSIEPDDCFKDNIQSLLYDDNDGEDMTESSSISASKDCINSAANKEEVADSAFAWGDRLIGGDEGMIPFTHLNQAAADSFPSLEAGTESKSAAVTASTKPLDAAARSEVSTAAAKKILIARYGVAIADYSNRDLQALLHQSLREKAVSESALASAVAVAAAELAAAEAENATMAATAVTSTPSPAATASVSFSVATNSLRLATAAMTEANDAVAALTASTKIAIANAAEIRNESESSRAEFRQSRLRHALRKQTFASGRLLAAAEALMTAESIVAEQNSDHPGYRAKVEHNDSGKPEVATNIITPTTQPINFPTPICRSASNGKAADTAESKVAAAPNAAPSTTNATAEVVKISAAAGTNTEKKTNPSELSEDTGDGGLDAIPSFPIDLDGNDAGSIPSLPSGDPQDESIILNIVEGLLSINGLSSSPNSQLTEDHNDDNTVPDLEELASSGAMNASLAIHSVANKKEVAESAISWTAFAGLLGLSIPSLIVDKASKRDKGSMSNLWDNGKSTCDNLDDLLAFSQDEICQQDSKEADGNNKPQVGHNDSLFRQDASEDVDPYDIRPLLAMCDENGNRMKQDCDQGSVFTRKLFPQNTPESDDDAHSIPYLSATSNDGDGSSSSPLTIGGSYAELSSSFMPVSSSISPTNLILA